MSTVEDVKQTQADYPWLKNYAIGVDWHEPIETESMAAIFDRVSERYGDLPCLDFLNKKYTYKQVQEYVNCTAKGLKELGVKKGTRVGLFLPNCPYFVFFYYAVLKLGGVVVNYNPLYAEKEVHHQIEDSGTEIMVTLDLKMLYDKIYQMLEETKSLKKVIICPMTGILPFPKNLLFPIFKNKEVAKIHRDERHIPFDKLVKNNGQVEMVEVNPEEDVAVIQYTGGTTGVPKGALLTHANVSANTFQMKLWFTSAEPGGEKMFAVIPFFHVFAMTVVMNMSIRLGFEIIMLPRFELEATLETITKKKPTMFVGVPTLYNAINNYDDIEKYDLSSLRYCISGGAPLAVEVKHHFEKLSGAVLVEGYGLTETAPVAVVNPFEGENRAGSIGVPIPGTVIDIVCRDDGETLMPVGKRGEVCISGPQVMKGYHEKPDETALVLKNGRFHTGDVGIMDEDGYIRIVDRIKDVILAGGYNVYPRNVEEAIYLNEKVEECVVLGVDDDYRGQTVKAFIKCRGDETIDLAELKEFLQDKLSPIEIPKILELRDELPKTMVGKLSRKALREEEEAKAE